MSMSQEEIEALMNGLDGPSSNAEKMADDIIVEEESEKVTEPLVKEDIDDNETLSADIDALINVNENSQKMEDLVNAYVKDDINDVLNEIDNMDEMDQNVELDSIENLSNDPDFTEKAITWTEDKITKGEFPFPAEPSTKVVAQLSEVAQDNEEKAGQIFDVLSYVVDDNMLINKGNKKIDTFISNQIELLNTLTAKFPNIAILQENLDSAKEAKGALNEISLRLSDEDMKLFEAMEIMQFHDINRQKIERVMSVIRKLTAYLNNLFEEDKEYEEIAVAKHIHGDATSNLVGAEDLDALIAEFNK